jgi:hypothetical protein
MNELAERIRDDRRTGALEMCLQQFTGEEHHRILGNLKLMKCDIRRYGWQYLEHLNTLKEQGYWMRPLEDLYLIEAALSGVEVN